MNKELYDYLMAKFKREVTVEQYERQVAWVNAHFIKLVINYSWIKLGGCVKWDDRVCKVKDVYINLGANPSILLATEYGNIWYFEAKQPTKKEIEKYLVESN